jgi:hypothetical protein
MLDKLWLAGKEQYVENLARGTGSPY